MSTDLILNDVEILPISGTKFGAIVEEEAVPELRRDGYRVKQMPGNEKPVRHYIEVNIGTGQQSELGFEVAALEWSGRGSIVIRPESWTVGKRSGAKAYLKAVTGHVRHHCILEGEGKPAHDGDHKCNCGKEWPQEERK